MTPFSSTSRSPGYLRLHRFLCTGQYLVDRSTAFGGLHRERSTSLRDALATADMDAIEPGSVTMGDGHTCGNGSSRGSLQVQSIAPMCRGVDVQHAGKEGNGGAQQDPRGSDRNFDEVCLFTFAGRGLVCCCRPEPMCPSLAHSVASATFLSHVGRRRHKRWHLSACSLLCHHHYRTLFPCPKHSCP